MTITVLFFAQARDRAGCARASLDVPDGARVRDALAAVARAYPALESLWPHLAVAVDGGLAGGDEDLRHGAELALLPPVSGGAPARAARAGRGARVTRRADGIDIHPATPERWDDVEALFGPRGACAGCWCMWARLPAAEFGRGKGAGNRAALRRIVRAGERPGVIAYDDGAPVGWCAVAPREHYRRLERSRALAPVDESPVWSVTCFFVARTHRGRGLTPRLLEAAVRLAAEHGARWVEGYPVDTRGATAAAAFVWTGLPGTFTAAGFTEVARRTPSRPIMRRRVAAPRGRG